MDPADSRPDPGNAAPPDTAKRGPDRPRRGQHPPESRRSSDPGASSGRVGRDRGQRGPADRSGGSGARDQRDERRRRRDGPREGGGRRAYVGFEDGIERAICIAFRAVPPPAFPIQPRHGVATLRMDQVASRPTAILFCDGAHHGAHMWPDGETVEEIDAPEAQTSQPSAGSDSSTVRVAHDDSDANVGGPIPQADAAAAESNATDESDAEDGRALERHSDLS